MEQPAQEYPTLSDRIQAVFADSILIIVSMFVFASFLSDEAPDWVRIILFFGIWAIYEPFSNSFFGCTLGGYIKGFRVRNYQHQEKNIGIFQAYLRYLVKTFLGWLSFLTIHTNSEKRAVHDLAAGSIVVLTRKQLP